MPKFWCFHNVKPLSLRVGHPDFFGVNSPFFESQILHFEGDFDPSRLERWHSWHKVPVAWYRYEPPMPLADHSRWRWAICPGGNWMLNWRMKIAFNWKFEWENHRTKSGGYFPECYGWLPEGSPNWDFIMGNDDEPVHGMGQFLFQQSI